MWIFLLALQLLEFSSTNFFVEEVVKLFDIFFFDALIFSNVGLGDTMLIDDVIELLRVANFDFDSDDVEAMLLADGVEEGFSVEYV